MTNHEILCRLEEIIAEAERTIGLEGAGVRFGLRKLVRDINKPNEECV